MINPIKAWNFDDRWQSTQPATFSTPDFFIFSNKKRQQQTGNVMNLNDPNFSLKNSQHDIYPSITYTCDNVRNLLIGFLSAPSKNRAVKKEWKK